jgi:rhodanese-related sulfurtransferase
MDEVPTVDVVEASRLVNEDGWLLLDVREADEWQAGHVAGAVHVPLANVPEAQPDADRRLVVMCRVGGRSARAVKFLIQQGYDAVNMAGGVKAWAAADLPIVTDDGRPGRVA